MPRTPRHPQADLAANIDAWVNHVDDTLHERTVAIYGKAARTLQTFLETQGVTSTRSITRRNLEGFYAFLRDDKGWAPATINQTHRALKQFFDYLLDEKELTESPMKHIKPPRIPETVHPTVTSQMQRKLLATVRPSTTFAGRRATAILSLFYDTGVRRGEMAGLKLDDIDWANRRLIVTGKAGKQRVVAFGRKTASHLKRYEIERTRWVNERRRRERYADNPWLWMGEQGPMTIYGIEDTVKAAAKAAGHPDLTCHAYRRGWTHEQIMLGTDAGAIAHLAGWNSIQMVDHYAKATKASRALETYRSPMDRLDGS